MPVRRTEDALKRVKARKREKGTRKPKTAKEVLEDDLDELWSKAVKKRDGYKCVRCGKPAVHAHHIFSRRHKRTRWDVRNGIALCFRDHFYFVKSSEIDDKKEYIELIEKQLREYQSTVYYLRRESQSVWKPTMDDLLELKDRLKEEL